MKKYKIFFQFFITISVALMAFYVSSAANDIASHHSKIMQTENQPVFIFSETRYPLPSYDKFGNHEGNNSDVLLHEELKISNVGKPFYNFHAESKCLLTVRYKNSSFVKLVNIPIQYYMGYFPAPGDGGGSSWILSDFNSENLKQLSDIQMGFASYSEDMGDEIKTYDFKKFVRIDYVDIFNNPQSQFFTIPTTYVNDSTVAIRLSEDEWREISIVDSNPDFYVNLDPTFYREKRKLSFDNSWRSSDVNNTVYNSWYQAIRNKEMTGYDQNMTKLEDFFDNNHRVTYANIPPEMDVLLKSLNENKNGLDRFKF